MSTTAIAYLLVFGALLVAALVRHPRYGLYAYVATFYLHPVDRWWGKDLPDIRWSLIAAAVTLLATLRLPPATDRPSWSSNTSAKILIALTTWIWIQNFWALSPEDHFELSILYTKYLVLLYMIYRLLEDEVSINAFLLAHVLGCLYLGALVLQARDTGRLEGVGGPGIDEANSLGMHLGTGAIAAAAILVRGTILQRAIAIAALPLIINGIIQTESRGAFLALIVGGIGMFILSPPRIRWFWIACGVLGVAVLVRIAPETFWERMSTISTSTEAEVPLEQGLETREALLRAQWKMFLHYPMGSGHRGTAFLSVRYLEERMLSNSTREAQQGTRARSSHNTLMTALAEQGIPGIVLFVWLLVWMARTSLTARSQLILAGRFQLGLQLMAIGGSLAVVLVAGLFADYFKAETFIWSIGMLTVIATLAAQGKSILPAENAVRADNAPPLKTNPRTRTG